MAEARSAFASGMGMSPEDLQEFVPSGQQTKFTNRVSWAKVYLEQAVLLESPRRGVFRITPRGCEVLKESPESIDLTFLSRFEEFRQFKQRRKPPTPPQITDSREEESTPLERLEEAHQQLQDELASDLLREIKQKSPEFFEKLVVKLMLELGYGGPDSGEVTPLSGDEGIDGIIKEDSLGLDVIYLQAKRRDGAVQRPEVQQFVGALQGKRAKKGVFITTGTFSPGAVEYAKEPEAKVVLIDGRKLVELMIGCGLGVSTQETYKIQRVDSNFFLED